MAQAARKIEGGSWANRPHLRLVPRPRSSNRPSARANDAARRGFALFSVMTIVLAAAGIGRVWLSVQATEASFEATRLRADIKSERYEGDMLEVRQSALGSPSRIRAIAGRAMDMAPAQTVTYVDLTQAARPSDDAEVTRESRTSAFKRAVGAFMDLTAGEAEVLLVGDVGLASTR